MSTPAHTRAQLNFIEEFATAAEWFAVTVASADLRAAVPTCPGWTVYDLVTHLGNVHAWAATVVETGNVAAEQNDEPAARKAKTVSEWYAGKAEDLYEVLRFSVPEAPCWNFAFGMGTAAFWPRRQLHETTMHGVDLALAMGRVPELNPDISADGIDEALRVFLHRMHRRGYAADLSAPITIVATDVERAWTIHPAAPPTIADGHTQGVDRIEGPAAAIYAMLWKRLPPTDSALSFTGDAARINGFLGSRLTA
ncbi:MAG TPA: maleylpyruvate isomerase family mycothiol-dependent enzyme [Nocardioidaceae bacterium]|nr:maleylpyruvate isomerase family mycothiol-dependent enzyme [Nocardioidaceae bacterium]